MAGLTRRSRRWRSSLRTLRALGGLDAAELSALRQLASVVARESVEPRRRGSFDATATISPLTSFRFAERVSVGAKANIGPFCAIWGGWSETWARVGAGALLSPGVILVAGNHRIEEPGWVRETGVDERDVEVGEGAWIGAHAVIVGCRVGADAVVGAGSVVLEDIPDGAIAVGAPARVVRMRGAQRVPPESS